MALTISDTTLLAARISETELLRDVAVMLYQQERLTLAQSSRLSGLSRFEFQHLLASKGIPIHYDVADLDADLSTLKKLGRVRDGAGS